MGQKLQCENFRQFYWLAELGLPNISTLPVSVCKALNTNPGKASWPAFPWHNPMWKALPWDCKCVPCLESVLLCLFSGRKLGFCLFLFTAERLLKLSECRFSVELGAVLLGAVVLLCGHHITTGRRFQEHSAVYKAHFFWKADFDGSCLPGERVRVLSHPQKDQKGFSRKSNMKVTSGGAWAAQGRQWCQLSWANPVLQVLVGVWVESGNPSCFHSCVHMGGQFQTATSPVQLCFFYIYTYTSPNSTVPGKVKLNRKNLL